MPSPFTFEFSLTVLNHLGRQLYRNFITVIGEAISNAWDADATNVWIDIDHSQGTMKIRDDGIGMTHDDIQNKFLKIGYSKRKNGVTMTSLRNRPFIGAKGIGKLALLSCADTVTIISRTITSQSEGCVIDNRDIDQAIREDKTTQEVTLTAPDKNILEYLNNQKHGTILIFNNVRMSNSTDNFLRKSLALFFRFTLIDSDFIIHFNGEKITVGNAGDLARKTQYLWKLGENFDDPFLKMINANHKRVINTNSVEGFLATVIKPRDLIVLGAKQKVGVDLFVNGRLRERNILSHRPSARIPAQYIYGQIHFNNLDMTINDPFTSSREAVMEDNEPFKELLDYIEKLTKEIFDEWDQWRLEDKEEGDNENKRMSKKNRAARQFINEQIIELFPQIDVKKPKSVFDRLLDEAKHGLTNSLDDYGHFYTLENLMRQIATKYDMKLSNTDKKTIKELQNHSCKHFDNSGLNKRCRSHEEDLWYLGIAELLKIVEREHQPPNGRSSLQAQADLVRYLRNIVMHTALLTDYGRKKLEAHIKSVSGILESIVTEEEYKNKNIKK